MAPQLKVLYDELIRAFTSRPSDLKKCTLILGRLKVGLHNNDLANEYYIFRLRFNS